MVGHVGGRESQAADNNLGEYQDRRNHDKIDCSNTIWILATNALDDTILDFCEKHDGIFNEDKIHKSTLVRQLTRQLQEVFLQKFDVSILPTWQSFPS